MHQYKDAHDLNFIQWTKTHYDYINLNSNANLLLNLYMNMYFGPFLLGGRFFNLTKLSVTSCIVSFSRLDARHKYAHM